MAVVLFLSEHLLVHSDRRGVVLGLILLAVQTLIGAVVFLATLSLLAPDTIREATTMMRRTDSRRPQNEGARTPTPL